MTAWAKFSSSFATDLQVSSGSNFEAKSDEKMVLDGTSGWKFILVAFEPRFSTLGGAFGTSGVALGDPWASLGRPWGSMGRLRDALGLPRGSPGTLWGPSWDPPGLPVASGGQSGKVLTSKTIKNGRISMDFRIIFRHRIRLRMLMVCGPIPP